MSDIEDNEVNPTAHKNLLQAISQLGRTQHIKKPTRSETSSAKDEFHLVKSSLQDTKDGTVSMGDIIGLLKKTNKQINLGKQLKNTQNPKILLQKPLERPVADRIQRTIGYEKAKKSLSRWDAVVAKNEASDFQVFPLDYEEIHVEMAAPKKPKGTTIKSDLMLEMEAVESKLRALKGEQLDDNKEQEHKIKEKLTREELIARRKELAYFRMRESQKSAKARIKNKIKSKKYHKLMKREKLKEHMKEFEILQKINPEAALEKLENIERNRVLERANLRHKNTGTWAKNLQIRAKYDKDVRKDLAEQVAISRELTQKQKENEDEHSDNESEENEKEPSENYDPFNPWVKVKKGGLQEEEEVINFVSGYRKYWTERNKNEKELKDFKKAECSNNEEGNLFEEKVENGETNKESSEREESGIEFQEIKNIPKKERIKKKRKPRSYVDIQSSWAEEDIAPSIKNRNIDDIFDDADEAIQQKISKKLEAISKLIQEPQKLAGQRQRQSTNTDYASLSFKTNAKHPEIDEELLETPANMDSLNELFTIGLSDFKRLEEDFSSNRIDPTKFTNIKRTSLKTSLPVTKLTNLESSGEFLDTHKVEVDNKLMTIAEAFEDDDIVADFTKSKECERKKDTVEDVDLTLPGWGSWAGSGISKEKKTKRLILKFANDAPRRDDNKGNVYINEDGDKKLKEHQVSNLPFPFQSVQDYEASIRAPIGRTFVPETAFKILTRPSIITKLGAIIDPMDDEVLTKPPKRPRTIVDARIAVMNENKNKKKKK